MEKKPDSFVAFNMISDLTGYEYKEFVIKLLTEFLTWVDPNIHNWAEQLSYRVNWNNESGLGMFQIDGVYVSHIKLYLYDETFSYTGLCARSIVFRDHYSEHDVEKVYLVSDKFELFLKSRQIKHSRQNRMR